MEASATYGGWQQPEVIEERLKVGYSDRLFFHVFSHAQDTRDTARELGKWCAYNGQEVDFYVLEWAALGHDFGYYAWKWLPDDQKQLFPSREKFAAAIVGGIMEELGAPEGKIAATKEAIWSTELNIACTSQEGRIIRQADLANVGSTNTPANIANFFWNTVKLYREDRLFKGRSPNVFVPHEFIAYCVTSYKVLSAYNDEDVSLGAFDRTTEGKSLFCQAASEKIPLLAVPERTKELAQKVGTTLLGDPGRKIL